MRRWAVLTIVSLLSLGQIADAQRLVDQTAVDHIAAGDAAQATRDLRTALREYAEALRMDSTNYTALVKAAHAAVDLGEFDSDHAERDSLYRSAEQYAQRAVAANQSDAEGHFELARADGRAAQTMGTRDKIKFAGVVRDQALEALRIDPNHAGAKHVLGEWNAEVMRLNRVSRAIAKSFLGGRVFGEASWDNAQRYLEEAVALEPNRIVHRLDLAAVYADRGEKSKALEQYDWIASAPVREYDDPQYKAAAAARRAALTER